MEHKGDEDFVSRDKRLNTLNKLKTKIKKERRAMFLMQSKELLEDKVSNFAKFILYFCFIIIYMVVVARHLNMHDRFEVFTSITADLKSRNFKSPSNSELINFYEIGTLSDYSAWVNMVIFQKIWFFIFLVYPKFPKFEKVGPLFQAC